MQRYVVLSFAIGSILVTGFFYYNVVFQNQTMLSPGVTAGVMGDDGPYQYLEAANTSSAKLWGEFAGFRKDLGPAAWQAEPYQAKNREAVTHWSWPLWNDNAAVGKPLAANFISNPWFPLKLVVYLFPNAVGWDWYFLLRFAVGLFFMALFLRQIGLRAIPSFFGGIMFAFSGYFILFQNIIDMDVGLLTPTVFWVAAYVLSLAKQGQVKPYSLLVAILVFASLLLTDVAEPLLLVLVAGAVFWIYLLGKVFFTDRKQFYTALWLSVQVVVPSFLIVLPQYWVNVELVNNSISVGHPLEAKVGLQFWLYDYFALYFFPYLHTTVYALPLQPVSPQSLNYIGITTFFLSVCGAIVALTKRKIALFLLVLLLVCVGKHFGIPEFLSNFIGQLPGLERVLFPKYIQPLISFAAAGLAAIGLQGLLSKTLSKRVYVGGLVVFIGILVFGLHTLYLSPNDGWVARYTEISSLNATFITLHLTGLAIIGWVLLNKITSRRWSLWLTILLGLIVTAELWLFVPRHMPQRYDSYTPPPFLDYLHSQEEPFRFFAFDRLIYPELSSALDLDDIRTLDVLYIKQYFLYIKNFISPGVYDRFTGAAQGTTELEPVHYLNNPLFDLLNVKYILAKTAPLDLFPANPLVTSLLAANTQSPSLHESVFVINQDARRVLLESAPEKACVDLSIEPDQTWLKFSTAVDKFAWTYAPADGMEFLVKDQDKNILFAFSQNPTLNPDDRRWIDHAVDLSAFAGRTNNFCFLTRPVGNSAADIGGWSNLRLTSEEDTSLPEVSSQYQLVYDGEIEIFENTQVFPRGFLVGQVQQANSDEQAIYQMQASEFDPHQQAILTINSKHPEPLPEQLSGTDCQGELTEYTQPNANTARFNIHSPGQCLMVFSEANFPGWVAYVDGVKTPIYQTDLLLRGLVLHAGDHHIEFIYRPHSFYYGLIGTAVGSLLAAISAYWAGRSFKKASKSAIP